MDARGIKYRSQRPSAYARRLHACVRQHEPERLVDLLLVCGLIEARSCERLKLLSESVPDAELSEFFKALLAAEGAGASRFFSQRRVLDLVGLNDHRLAHATQDPELKNCLIADAGPELVLVPEAWLADLEPGFELQEVGRFESKSWSVIGGLAGRTVVAARARLRPQVVRYCMTVLQRK